MNSPGCRNCKAPLTSLFVDLGVSPLANRLLRESELLEPEPHLPLKAYVCDRCLLVQLPPYASPDLLFTDYVYFSSFSSSFLEQCMRYADAITDRLGLDRTSKIVEVASNDGYLLRFFRDKGLDVLGIEPAANVAEHASNDGIPTITEFFGSRLAEALRDEYAADLLIGNNVLAHVPDLHDFVEGLGILLGPKGTITMEFPHILKLIEELQFDTIYHEHFSYFSLAVVIDVFAQHDLTIFDVDEIPTHGGSLRIYARHAQEDLTPTNSVSDMLASEKAAGLNHLNTYLAFGERVPSEKRTLLKMLIEMKERGQMISAYGAPAKGNTLLNYCGIGTDLIDFAVDTIPEKQGRYLPGSRIPVLHPNAIEERRPDVVFVLPWNLRQEIVPKLEGIGKWGGKILVRTPGFTIIAPSSS